MMVILIQFAKSFSALFFVLISGFAKNANFSNDIFKYETRMSPRAMKVQQIGHKCYAANPSKKSENSKTSINFFTYSQLQYKLCGLISDCYCVTLPSPQVAKCFDLSKIRECLATGYSAIYVIYAKLVVKMCCSTILPARDKNIFVK